MREVRRKQVNNNPTWSDRPVAFWLYLGAAQGVGFPHGEVISLKNKFLLAGLLAGAVLGGAQNAAADEVWSLPSGGQIVYDRDVADVAVLTYTPEQGLERGQIFVVGLGGQYEGRGKYQAYWVEADDAGPACPAALVDAEGTQWRRWGLATVAFLKPDFPSGIVLSRGECLSAPEGKISAKPVVGAGLR